MEATTFVKIANRQTMDQHYVPQCYLKGFVDSKKKIWKHRLRVNYNTSPRPFHPAQVAYAPDFYRLKGLWWQTQSVHDPDVIEKVINHKYEQKLIEQIRNISSFISFPSLPDRINFAETILHLKRRNIHFREKIYSKDNLAEIRKNFFDTLLEEDSSTLNAIAELEGVTSERVIEIAKQLLSEMSDHDHFLKEMHNHSLLNRSGSDEALHRIHNYLATADWIILKAPVLSPFITSDNPGFLIDGKGTIKSMGFEGTFRFYLPLNARNTLLISKTSKPYSYIIDVKELNKNQVEQINTGIALTAHNHIFGPSKRSLESISLNPRLVQSL